MSIREDLKANPALFVGVVVVPTLLLLAVAVFLAVTGDFARAPNVPIWAWYVGFGCLPILAAMVGSSVTLVLHNWLAKRPHAIFFSIVWNVVFCYLSFFVLIMGFADGPPPESLEQFQSRLTSIVTMGFPLATVAALIVCAIATVIFMAVWDAVARVSAKECSEDES